MAKSKTSTYSTTVHPITYMGKMKSLTKLSRHSTSDSRQAMYSNLAWKRHGCYRLGSEQYFNMPLEKALFGCHDDWNSLDHFDPTTNTRLLISRFHHLRESYGVLQDGFRLRVLGNWTYHIQRPGSNGTETEMGLWSAERSVLPGHPVGGLHQDPVWLFYTNENVTKTQSFNCRSRGWISSPYVGGTVVRNLFYPYETYTLENSLDPVNKDGRAPWTGCMPSITMDPFGFKALVPVDQWVAPRPTITKFTPGHDARISSDAGANIPISLEFNTIMACDGVTRSISLEMSSSGKGSTPAIDNVVCTRIENPPPPTLPGAPASEWRWSATLVNVPDGVLYLTVDNAPASTGGATTTVCCLTFSP